MHLLVDGNHPYEPIIGPNEIIEALDGKSFYFGASSGALFDCTIVLLFAMLVDYDRGEYLQTILFPFCVGLIVFACLAFHHKQSVNDRLGEFVSHPSILGNNTAIDGAKKLKKESLVNCFAAANTIAITMALVTDLMLVDDVCNTFILAGILLSITISLALIDYRGYKNRSELKGLIGEAIINGANEESIVPGEVPV